MDLRQPVILFRKGMLKAKSDRYRFELLDEFPPVALRDASEVERRHRSVGKMEQDRKTVEILEFVKYFQILDAASGRIETLIQIFL